MGQTGVSKSAFVNALMGVSPNEPGAAACGIRETTKVAAEYTARLGGIVDVLIMDTPGVGTARYPAEKLDEFWCVHNLDRFDLIIVMYAQRFMGDSVELTKMCLIHDKQVIIVRSKADEDVQNTLESMNQTGPLQLVEPLVRGTMDGEIKANLRGCVVPQYFLISTRSRFFDWNSLLSYSQCVAQRQSILDWKRQNVDQPSRY